MSDHAPIKTPANSFLSDQETYTLVAAIDFGTTFSGYAFSIKSKGDIHMNKNWGSEFNHTSYKAPTCVLTDPDGKFVSFGFEAERDFLEKGLDSDSDYEDDDEKDEAKKYNLYRNFKMLLHDHKKISLKSKISSTSGTKRAALDIFAMALKYLKDHMIKAIRASNISEETTDSSSIKWVITVPAIWSDEAKQFIRQACHKAGLISSVDPGQLVVALEPEAASVYCRSLKSDEWKTSNVNDITSEPGGKYMVVDCGGGTVDITAHELLQSGDLREIHPPSGGPWGGKNADEKFEQLMKDLFGAEFIDSYKKENQEDWFDLLMAFEKGKLVGDGDIRISVSFSFGSSVQQKHNVKGIKEILRTKHLHGVKWKNGFLIIPCEKARSLFKEAVDNIVKHITSMLDNSPCLSDLKYLFMVGGFSQLPMLQQEIITLFKEKIPECSVLVPLDGQLAIVKGAVMFAYQPSIIRSRITQYSYGLDVMLPFDLNKHDPKHKVTIRGKSWCTALYKPLVTIGDEIQLNTRVSHKVYLNDESKYNGYTELDIYRSTKRDIFYTYDHGVSKAAMLKIDHDFEIHNDSCVEIIVCFGSTEITVQAKDAHGDTWHQTSLNFLK